MNGISDLKNFYALFSEPALAKDLITILEDYRINSRLKAEYPVLGVQISEMNVHTVSQRPSLDELANDKQRAVELIAQRLSAGTTKEQVPGNLLQTLEQALSICQPLSSSHADIHETARVAAELYFLIDDQFQGPYKQMYPFSAPLDQSQVNQNIGNFGRTARKISENIDSEADKSPPGDDKRANDFSVPSEDAVSELLRALYKEKGIKPKAVESRIDALEPNKVLDYLSELETLITAENGLQSERGTYLYPEWGIDIKDYRLNWSRIREQMLEGGSDEFYQDTIRKYAGQIKIIRREFQMLRPEGLVKLRGQFDGDDINLDATVQYFIKDFEDSYDLRVQCKISTMTNKQSTRIAPAIRHTTTKLRRREERTRMLILLSDGKPLDRDYYGNYAIEDMRMALKEAQRYGVKSFCITVDREAAAYLPRMYADSRWVVIDDVLKLPAKITRIYKRFTT
ncbi:MAG: hypothetical protein WBB08_11095 [Halobacteriota archaeon]